MEKIRLLFVSTGQGARARIAEYFMHYHGHGLVRADSASFDPGEINLHANQTMLNTSCQTPIEPARSVFEHFADETHYHYVITLSDDLSNEHCSLFRQCINKLYGEQAHMIYWSIPDFSSLGDTPADLHRADCIRDQVNEHCNRLAGEIEHIVNSLYHSANDAVNQIHGQSFDNGH